LNEKIDKETRHKGITFIKGKQKAEITKERTENNKS
jgi:hypothetical protein